MNDTLFLTAAPASAGPGLLPWILGLLGLAALVLAGIQTWFYIQYLRKARRRRRKNTYSMDMTTIILYAAGVILLVLALILGSGGNTEPTEESTEPSTEDTQPTIQTGWVQDGDSRYYMYADGTYATGWVEMDGRMYYFQDNGLTLQGWQELEGITRYFREDGSMARGQETVDGVTRFFTSSGAEVVLVNPWNPIGDTYETEVELVELSNQYAYEGIQVSAEIYDALIDMMDACNESAPRCCVSSGYRTMEDQEWTFRNKVNSLLNQGYSQEEAEAQAAIAVAAPGCSEHQLGLAVDIIDTRIWSGETAGEELFPVHQWLEDHSWEYGFILRYPEGKTDVTGIMYEYWHFRYVGLELAQELYESGLTLEEYLNALD